jgi:hypothetical protein
MFVKFDRPHGTEKLDLDRLPRLPQVHLHSLHGRITIGYPQKSEPAIVLECVPLLNFGLYDNSLMSAT